MHLPSSISPDPLKRFGLMDPTRDSLRIVACCFSAYHTTEFRFRNMFDSGGPLNPRVTMSGPPFFHFLETFALSLREEANELGLPAKSFSHQDWVSFVQECHPTFSPVAVPALSSAQYSVNHHTSSGSSSSVLPAPPPRARPSGSIPACPSSNIRTPVPPVVNGACSESRLQS